MTDREAMQQALEALKLIDDAMPFPVAKLAMKNLRERLAHCDRCGKKLGGPDDIHTCSPQQPAQEPEQEPVAWRTFDGEGNYDFRDYDMNENYDKEWAERNPTYAHWVEPLYTNPPQRKPLTNEYRAYKKELKQQFGMPCPNCIARLPKAQPKILIPNQKCWCGYRDNRPREKNGNNT